MQDGFSKIPSQNERTKNLRIFLQTKIRIKEAIDENLLNLVDQALTHTSAKQKKNYEKLEFLGDAVLRLAATKFIEQHYPDLNVGNCSDLRSHLVSDDWLAQVGEEIDITNYIILGKHALKDFAAQKTIRADATEALIGALYSAYYNIEVINNWLTPFWLTTAAEVLATPHRFNGKTALQEWSQGQGLGLPHYATEECSRQHGDPERFRCRVSIQGQDLAEAKGRSRKEAEQNAATAALQALEGSDAPQASQ